MGAGVTAGDVGLMRNHCARDFDCDGDLNNDGSFDVLASAMAMLTAFAGGALIWMRDSVKVSTLPTGVSAGPSRVDAGTEEWS